MTYCRSKGSSDAVNRLTSKTYSDSTPPASFSYDQSSVTIGSWSSGTLSNPLGRMTEATTSASGQVNTAVVYSYDPVGRVASFWQCNPSNCGTLSIWNTQYNYDLAGDITSWVHPGGFKLTNTVNGAQQITAVQSSWQDSNHPQYLAQSISYTPWGAVSQLQNGCVGSGCTNAQETYTYNNRLQPWMIQVSGTSNGGYCLVYNYFSSWTPPSSCPSPSSVPTSGWGNNGNVMGYWYQDSVQSGFSHTASYTYDSVNRLSTAVATGTYSAYNLTFSYDPYGNMTCVTNGQTWGYCPNWAFNASTNQLATSGFTYDAAGNLTKDSSNASAHTYQWDAEGRAASVDSGSTWKFTYNAVGDRVQWAARGGTQQQLFDPAGMSLGVVGMYSVVWSRNAPFALYLGGNTQFNHINNLGSTTLRTDQSGTAVEDMLFYPWGDVWQSWGGGGYTFAATPYDDVTTTTSPTMYRFYSMNLGRWHSPDPLAGDITNPQSLNRYAYVMNNPTSFVDPLGLACANPNGQPCGPAYDPSTCDGIACSPWGGGGTSGLDIFTALEFLQTWVTTAGENGDAPTFWIFFNPDAAYLQGFGPGGGLAILPLASNSPALLSLAPTACPSTSAYSEQYNFASSNLAAAQTIANQLAVSAAEILGLAAVESRNGTSNIAVNYNNYFGLTSGPAYGGTIGTYTTPGGTTFGVYPSPGFLNSGLSFANSYQGQRVSLTWGSPQLFVNALTDAPRANFNSEPGTANTYLSAINLMSLIIPCL